MMSIFSETDRQLGLNYEKITRQVIHINFGLNYVSFKLSSSLFFIYFTNNIIFLSFPCFFLCQNFDHDNTKYCNSSLLHTLIHSTYSCFDLWLAFVFLSSGLVSLLYYYPFVLFGSLWFFGALLLGVRLFLLRLLVVSCWALVGSPPFAGFWFLTFFLRLV